MKKKKLQIEKLQSARVKILATWDNVLRITNLSRKWRSSYWLHLVRSTLGCYYTVWTVFHFGSVMCSLRVGLSTIKHHGLWGRAQHTGNTLMASDDYLVSSTRCRVTGRLYIQTETLRVLIRLGSSEFVDISIKFELI